MSDPKAARQASMVANFGYPGSARFRDRPTVESFRFGLLVADPGVPERATADLRAWPSKLMGA